MFHRIYYKDTDAGGVVYHSRYVEFLEIARTEKFRKICPNFFEIMKKEKIILPVISLNVEYLKPVFYNNLLFIECNVFSLSALKVNFEYFIYCCKDKFHSERQLTNKAKTFHCFIDSEKLLPKRVSKNFLDLLNKIK